jgi:hypothetical protein
MVVLPVEVLTSTIEESHAEPAGKGFAGFKGLLRAGLELANLMIKMVAVCNAEFRTGELTCPSYEKPRNYC